MLDLCGDLKKKYSILKDFGLLSDSGFIDVTLYTYIIIYNVRLITTPINLIPEQKYPGEYAIWMLDPPLWKYFDHVTLKSGSKTNQYVVLQALVMSKWDLPILKDYNWSAAVGHSDVIIQSRL